MWCLFLIVSAIFSCLASKERVPLQNIPEDEKHILFELVKRLGKGRDLSEIGWRDQVQCDVSTNKNSIIKKVDSVNNGAKFLTLSKETETNGACSDLCCKNESCDLAVYENKGDHYCYLFRCEGKCKFGHHSSYISNHISHHSQSQQPMSVADGSELDLINLNQGFDNDSAGSDKKDSLHPTTIGTTTASTTSTVYIRAHSVGLEGPYCERDLHCEDPNAVCTYHKCLCREGYYQKGHICRQVCPPSNFECLELGTLGRGPQCVSDIQVCDSVMQCADGSDEINCPDSGAPPIRTWQQKQQMPLNRVPQQSLQQPSVPQQQHQALSQGVYEEPQYGYHEQGMMDPHVNGLEHSNNRGSLQDFPDDRQNLDQDGNGNYINYNPQPKEPHQSTLFTNSGRLPMNSLQSPSQPYPQSSNNRYGSAADDQFTGKGKLDADSNNPGPYVQPPVSKNKQQPASMPQNNHGTAQRQPPSKPVHAVPDILPQPDVQQPYQQQLKETDQKMNPNKPILNSESQQHLKTGGPQHPYLGPQATHKGPVDQQPGKNDEQPHKVSDTQSYQPSKPQQYPVSGGKVGNQWPAQQPIASKSQRPSDTNSQSVPEQTQSEKSKVFVEGGEPVSNRPLASSVQEGPKQKQDLPSKNLPQMNPKIQKTIFSAAHSAEPKPSAKVGSVANAHVQDSHPAKTSSDLIDSQNHPPQSKTDLQQLHPHSAYDVRIGAPRVDGQKTGNRQQPFIGPTELNDLNAHAPSHYLEGFGDQYLPQQGFGQQFNPYNRYPSNYAQNSGNGANSFSGMSDQLYPGLQGQRLYPQQGYVDFGYPSPQYEFGEFDPAYPESENYPGGHDMPAYRPDSKLGYDAPYIKQGVLSKNDKTTLHTEEGSPADPDSKTEISSQGDDEDAEQARNPDQSDDKKKPDPDHLPPSEDTDKISASDSGKEPSDKLEEGKQDTANKDDIAKPDTSDTVNNSAKEGDDKSEKAETNRDKNFGKNKGAEDLIQSQNAFISKVKVDLPSEPANMQGPIIALSLGLAFTVILLIFVACRLRNVRRRLRKGRPLHSNEADYLINGMYL